MSEMNESVKPSDVLDELRNSQDNEPIFLRLILYAKLIRSHDFATAEHTEQEWEPILRHILGIMSRSSEYGDENYAFACRAFYALLSTQPKSWRLSEIIMQFLKLESCNLHFLEQQYVVSDLELFKLLNAYLYMCFDYQDDMYNDSILLTMFDIIQRNCMKYTRYSAFAYKVLELWLRRTRNYDINFWERRDIVLEQKLEAVIFSNWSNAIQDVRKLNAQIFGQYLQIMSNKYDGFLSNIVDICDEHISWQNETRFTILAEVLRLWHNVETMTRKFTWDFLFKLVNALTNKSLHNAATNVYLVILSKLNENEWMYVFDETMETMIERWCSKESEDYNALYALCELWLEPTVRMHEDLIAFLWDLERDPVNEIHDNHLPSFLLFINMTNRVPRMLERMYTAFWNIDDSKEATRGNIIRALCYCAVDYPHLITGEHNQNPFFRIKHFLWFNANASISMCEVIVKSIKILYSKILRTVSIQGHCTEPMSDFTMWLHDFLLDCLEIGSCHQRKILALKLYTVMLDLTSRDSYKSSEVYLRNVAAIDKYLRATNIWRFTDKESLFVLLRLVLDNTRVVRQLAANLILKYFEKDALSTADKDVIYKCGLLHCNSSKLYEIESGATLMKILAHWASPGGIREESSEAYQSSWTNLLLDMARQQLTLMKSDILKAVAENCPFHGTLTALLAVTFRVGPKNRNLSPQFTAALLSLAEDATDFFLSTLFMKESNIAYLSSLTEMELVVNEHIRASEIDDCNYNELQLSPAQQVLISCIWLSLKMLCEVASEIGILMQSDAMVKSSMDIIVTVLLKCRHKDVVESAGMAIANLSRHLYDKKDYCELPKTYLMNLLEEDTGGELMHLTRRGAGLSVMFHRLVVSDKRKSRPTVHFAVRKLLRSLANFSLAEMRRVKSEEDSPWAIRLHFLRALVADKEIHYSLVPYMEEICLRCFDYIESDVSTVRNASLQLYGAVVPRLVGQCSDNKNDDLLDFADGYSFNHFVTHYPMLADRMLTQLQATSKITGTSGAALRSYAKLAHTLVLLSRMWTGDCDLVDYPSTALIEKFRNLLYKLCEKPMIHIRQLAAKAYVALTPITRLGSTLRSIKRTIYKSKDSNFSYGLFLILRYFTERLKTDNLARSYPILHCMRGQSFYHCPYEQCNIMSDMFFSIENFDMNYKDISTAWRDIYEGKEHYKQPCYMLETQFCEKDINSDCFSLSDNFFHEDEWSIIERITPSQKIQPGFFQFLSSRALLFTRGMENRMKISKETFDKSVPTITRVLNSSCTEQSIGVLNGLSQSVPLFEFILTYLISMRDDHDPLLLEHIVTLARKMIKNVDLFKNNESDLDDLARRFCEIEASTVATSPSVIYMKYALILAFSEHEALINDALLHLLGLCADDDESMRLAATDYIEFAFRRYARLTNEGKFTLMKCCLILLKDEIAEIRNVVSTLLQKKTIYYDMYCFEGPLNHDEITYQRFLEVVIQQLLHGELSVAGDTPNEQVANVISYFTREIRDSADSKARVEDPFYHDDATSYKEESKFLSLCYVYMKLGASGKSLFLSDGSFFYDVTRAIEISRELRQKIAPDCDDLRTVLYTKEMDFLTRKRDFVLQYLSTLAVRPVFPWSWKLF